MNISSHNMEIEQIYTQVLSIPGRSIAICSANSGEGVTSLVLALAQRNLLAGHSTLVVDLNLYRPSIKSLMGTTMAPGETNTIVTTELLTPPQLITSDESNIALTGIIAPNRRENIMKLRQPGALEQCISNWLQEYDSVIIDTSPINRINANNIPPERVAAACDGAILMVLAGHTSETMVTTAANKLHTANAQLLGCVFNDYDNPSLKNELLREVQRLDSRFSWLAQHIKKFLNTNRLLTLEV